MNILSHILSSTIINLLMSTVIWYTILSLIKIELILPFFLNESGIFSAF